MRNAYLEGPFAPVREEHTLTELSVTGAIPGHLDGRYLRTGPNPATDVDPEIYHWFSGDGMVHGIRLRDGRAEWYRNRWVRTPSLARDLGEELSHPQPRNTAAIKNSTGANTNVLTHAGHTLALIEAGLTCYELTEDLDTVGPWDFDGTVRGGYTAHPLRDPATGELHAVSYCFGWGDKVRYTVIGTDGRARRTVDIKVTGSPMMHSFSLTEKYVVLYDLPVTFDPRQAVAITVPGPLSAPARLVMSATLGRVPIPDPIMNLISRRAGSNGRIPYHWNHRYPARIGVMPREGAPDVRWFDVEPCYVYHPMNAYDAGETIVLDVVRYSKMFVDDLHGLGDGGATLDRWTIDLAAGKVVETRLDDRPQEFPRIAEHLVGREHRYGYSVGFATDKLTGTLLKHDLRAGSTAVRDFGPGSLIGEFVFEPAENPAAEDDGILMGLVHQDDNTDLTLLDAATLETVATVHLPVRIPFGFHGNWSALSGGGGDGGYAVEGAQEY